MVRVFLILIMFIGYLESEALAPNSINIEKNCIACHTKQKIPSELIYRRYLTKYSTHKTIRKVIFNYLKNPTKENSIMPKQFFLKFPPKEPIDMNDTALIKTIDTYLDYFDIKRKLVLP